MHKVIKVSIVIVAYNEILSLEECVNQVTAEITKQLNIDYEVIIVDDGSEDGTWQLIEKLSSKHCQIKGVRFSRNFGKESAIYAGLSFSEGSGVIVMDADLQHPPYLISEMIFLWLNKGIAVVEASKELRQKESVLHRIGANAFYAIFKITTGIDIRRATDFKLLDRKVVNVYLSLPERTRFFRGLSNWLGFSRTSVSFIPPERKEGESRWSLKLLLRMARYSLMSFTVIPLQIVTWIGLLTLVFSTLMGMQTLANKLLGIALDGFTTVILVQLMIGSILMIALGLIGEYVGRIYEEIKKRPLYIVAETIPAKNREKREARLTEIQGLTK